ncbi:MAG: EamA family transporter [Desulfuromonadaceae bacterium]|nr:EamA family transporter [Desulfuromonadaceae bacterium]
MSTLWLPLTLICAFSLATSDALTKKALSAHNEYLILWLRLLLTLPFLLVPLLFIPVPPLGQDFFHASLIALPLEAAATFLYIRALKISPLSLTLPFLALTPVFLLVIPFLLLGEKISPAGGLGILLVASGAYLLHLGEGRKGILEPFRAIGKERGSLYMILVAVLYSVTATLGKKAISASSPLFFAACYFPALVLILTPAAICGAGRNLQKTINKGILRAILPAALCYAVMIVTHMLAVSLAPVAYMISVKRLSLLIGVFYGHLLFREKGLGERALGTVTMILGGTLIAMSG